MTLRSIEQVLDNVKATFAVRPLMPNTVMSAINLVEIATIFMRGGMPAAEVELALCGLPIRMVPIGEGQAYQARVLRPLTADKSKPLGDRGCLALACSLALPALTCDRAWGALPSDVGVEVKLAR